MGTRTATRPRKRLPAPPAPRFESFALETGDSSLSDEDALRQAGKVVAEELGPAWKVRPLGREGGREFEALPREDRRRRPIGVARAWDIAAKLKARRDVASAEPLFETVGLEPPPGKAELSLLPRERLPQAKGGPAAPLPGAASDCLWSLRFSRILEAWQLVLPPGGSALGAGIRIAHPDTGFTQHPEIWNAASPRILAPLGFDYVDDDPDATDPLSGSFGGHGTGTASVIMSDHVAGAQAPFVSGAAPRAELVPLRVGNSVIHLSFSRLTRALHHAVDEGFPVVSMSLGGPVRSGALERAVARAVANGTILLAAAGNVWPWVVYPARFDDVIAVAACNAASRPWKNSARGPAVDVAAPGESVWRATIGDDGMSFGVGMGSGTSFAVATTAGACALWLAYHGGPAALAARFGGASSVPRVFRELLMSTAQVPAGWDADDYGAGILDAKALLQATLPAAAPAVPKKALLSAAQRPGVLELAVDYFPGIDPDRVVAALLGLLEADGKRLRKTIAEVGDEILFQIATSPDFRSRIVERAMPRSKGPRSPSRRTNPTALSKRLRSLMKP